MFSPRKYIILQSTFTMEHYNYTRTGSSTKRRSLQSLFQDDLNILTGDAIHHLYLVKLLPILFNSISAMYYYDTLPINMMTWQVQHPLCVLMATTTATSTMVLIATTATTSNMILTATKNYNIHHGLNGYKNYNIHHGSSGYNNYNNYNKPEKGLYRPLRVQMLPNLCRKNLKIFSAPPQ